MGYSCCDFVEAIVGVADDIGLKMPGDNYAEGDELLAAQAETLCVELRKMQTERAALRDLENIHAAINNLKMARTYLRGAGARKSVAYVSAAIKSAQGAENHAIRAHRTQATAILKN